MSDNVVPLDKRAAMVRGYLAKKDDFLKISNMREALAYGDTWQAQARRMEAMLTLATAQRDAADLLLQIAEEELARMRKLLA